MSLLMKMIYGIKDRPSAGKLIVFAFQQMIAIMAATLLVPLLVSQAGIDLDPAAALFGLVNPSPVQWLTVFCASFSIIPFAEVYKAVLNALSSRKGGALVRPSRLMGRA